MRRLITSFSFLVLLALAPPAQAAVGRVIKVLPLFLDAQGRHSLSPSLYERDAYQAVLRQQPEKRSGLLFAVHWKSRGQAAAPLRLRLELRGIAEGNLPRQLVLEQKVEPRGWFGHWSNLTLTGDKYRQFGEVTAWHVTFWEGNQLLGEQQSFLW